MKTEWLIAHLTAVGSPAVAEYENFKNILDSFRPAQATFVVGEPLWDRNSHREP